MSGFAIFQKINAKLDEGWKLSNISCPVCNTIILGNPTSKQFYCFKCEMPAKVEVEEEEEDVEIVNSGSGNGNGSATKVNEVEEFDNMLFAKENEARRKKGDEMSKKMGEYLLKGWAMLEEACEDCLFPYMRSKAGEIVCVGCGPVNQKKKEPAPQKPVVSETITSSPEIIRSKEAPKEEVKETKPVEKEEKIVEAPKRERKEKSCRPHRVHERVATQETVSLEVIEKFRFDESINLYSKMTQLLSNNLDDLEDQGLSSDLNKLKDILELQKQIDEAKTKVLLLHTKTKKH